MGQFEAVGLLIPFPGAVAPAVDGAYLGDGLQCSLRAVQAKLSGLSISFFHMNIVHGAGGGVDVQGRDVGRLAEKYLLFVASAPFFAGYRQRLLKGEFPADRTAVNPLTRDPHREQRVCHQLCLSRVCAAGQKHIVAAVPAPAGDSLDAALRVNLHRKGAILLLNQRQLRQGQHRQQQCRHKTDSNLTFSHILRPFYTILTIIPLPVSFFKIKNTANRWETGSRRINV